MEKQRMNKQKTERQHESRKDQNNKEGTEIIRSRASAPTALYKACLHLSPSSMFNTGRSQDFNASR